MKKYVCLLCFCVSITLSNAQEDAQLSLFNSSPLAINPAMAGYFHNAQWRAWFNHRDQWSSFLNRGLITSNFSFDMPVGRANNGFGIFVSNNSSLKGAINDMTIMGNVSFCNSLNRRGDHKFTFGLQAGIKQKSFKMDQLRFGSQYIDGLGFQKDMASGENLSKNSKLYLDFNAGLLWFVDDRWKNNKPWLGAAVYHLIRPDESFTNYESRLPRKILVSGGSDYILNRNMALLPRFLLANQGDFTQFSIGSMFDINNFRGKTATSFDLGMFYRSSDAFVMAAGFEFSHFRFLFNYDINISNLKTASRGIGGVEVTLIYIKSGGENRNVKFY